MTTTQTSSTSMTPLLWGLLLLLSVLWGGSFFFAEIALGDLPPLTLVLARVATGAAFLLLWAAISRQNLQPILTHWRAFAVMAILNNLIPFTLIFWGQIYIASGLAAILNATTPLFTILLAHFLTSDEKITWPRATGVMLGFFGVVVMVGPGLLENFTSDVAAQLAILAAALSYAFAGIYGRRFRDLNPVATASGQLCASTLLFIPLVCLMDQPWNLPLPSLHTWLAVAGIGLLSTAMGYLIFFRILAAAGATNLLLVTFLIPVSALVLGIGLLNESLTTEQVLGMGLIAAGLIAVDGRIFRRQKGNLAPPQS
ncbi:MAG: DMT family transporter [Pseudomonadota bacterium]